MKKWSGATSVNHLKAFVLSEIQRMEACELNKRTIRQLNDAYCFLTMLEGFNYANCQRIENLKSKITQNREKLKETCKSMDKFLPGYQFTLFDGDNEVEEEKAKRIEAQKKILEEEIHWLHKCLGICHNKEYFK